MINTGQLKQLVINSESEWMEEIFEGEELDTALTNMKSEIYDCVELEDVILYFEHSGMKPTEARDAVIKILLDECKIED